MFVHFNIIHQIIKPTRYRKNDRLINWSIEIKLVNALCIRGSELNYNRAKIWFRKLQLTLQAASQILEVSWRKLRAYWLYSSIYSHQPIYSYSKLQQMFFKYHIQKVSFVAVTLGGTSLLTLYGIWKYSFLYFFFTSAGKLMHPSYILFHKFWNNSEQCYRYDDYDKAALNL